MTRAGARIAALALLVTACGPDGLDCPSDLPAECPAPAPSFQTQVDAVIEGYCFPCHGPDGVEQPLHDFTTYDKIFTQRRDILTQVYACKMPPSDSAQLLPEERAAILAWLVCGAPNN